MNFPRKTIFEKFSLPIFYFCHTFIFLVDIHNHLYKASLFLAKLASASYNIFNTKKYFGMYKMILSLPTNIALGWKCFPATNTLPYYENS